MADDGPALFPTMYSARALRRFKPDPIPDDVLFQVFDAAIRAPSGQNAQDWRFVVIRDPDLKRDMQAWAEEAWARYQPAAAEDPTALDQLPRTQRLSLRSVEHLVHHLAEVPAIVVVTGLKGRHSTPGGSAFPAVQNMLLAARALGLGGSIFNLPLGHVVELMERIGLPENNQVYCLVPMGYPTDQHGPLRRKPVRDVVFIDRWQQRWPFAEEQPDEGWTARWLGQ